MKIKYIRFPGEGTRVESLSDILTGDLNSGCGAVETAVERANAAIDFTSSLVEILYDSKVINDKDISNLVSKICYCNKKDVKVVK